MPYGKFKLMKKCILKEIDTKFFNPTKFLSKLGGCAL